MRAAQLVRTNRCLRARIMEEVGALEEASDGDGAPPLLNPTRPHQYPASVLGPTIEFALAHARAHKSRARALLLLAICVCLTCPRPRPAQVTTSGGSSRSGSSSSSSGSHRRQHALRSILSLLLSALLGEQCRWRRS